MSAIVCPCVRRKVRSRQDSATWSGRTKSGSLPHELDMYSTPTSKYLQIRETPSKNNISVRAEYPVVTRERARQGNKAEGLRPYSGIHTRPTTPQHKPERYKEERGNVQERGRAAVKPRGRHSAEALLCAARNDAAPHTVQTPPATPSATDASKKSIDEIRSSSKRWMRRRQRRPQPSRRRRSAAWRSCPCTSSPSR